MMTPVIIDLEPFCPGAVSCRRQAAGRLPQRPSWQERTRVELDRACRDPSGFAEEWTFLEPRLMVRGRALLLRHAV